ncbi:MAG: hypothetical protein WDM88_09410 [Galbitalea sp.]
MFIVGISVIGVLAPVIVNQVLVGPNHDYGGDAAIIGTPVTAAVLGALAVLVLRMLSGRRSVRTRDDGFSCSRGRPGGDRGSRR